MRISAETALLDAAAQNPEIAPFAMFELDLSQTVDPTTGGLAFPELEGKHTPLWSITSNGGVDASEARETRQAEQDARLDRVKAMATRVGEGLPALEEDDRDDSHDTPSDGWDHFWGGASPTQRGWV